MKDFVRPTIDRVKWKFEVLAGIETEIDRENNRVFQPRIYLIDYMGQNALYFCYRKGRRDGRKGGYGMFISERDMETLSENPTSTKNLTKLKDFLQKLTDSIPRE